jgi:hypothetical protein
LFGFFQFLGSFRVSSQVSRFFGFRVHPRVKNETHTRTQFYTGWVRVQPVDAKMNLNPHPSGLKPVGNPNPNCHPYLHQGHHSSHIPSKLISILRSSPFIIESRIRAPSTVACILFDPMWVASLMFASSMPILSQIKCRLARYSTLLVPSKHIHEGY